MADFKTDLRELSVATTLGLLVNNINFRLEDLFRQDFFWYYVRNVVPEAHDAFQSPNTDTLFSDELQQIINNGYNLGLTIFNHPHFILHRGDQISWRGFDTKKDDPIDVYVGAYGFSLKEESFILENMGLYKLLNCYTGSSYKKRHIFKDYAIKEYNHWFFVTWNLKIHWLSNNNNYWSYENLAKFKKTEIYIYQGEVIFNLYQNSQIIEQSILNISSNLSDFENRTSAKTREEVFSRFINMNLSNNNDYNQAKKNCAVIATQNLAKELIENLNYAAGLPRFLRIHDKEYYYAKTTNHGVEIYRVPSIVDFHREIVIDDIESYVPESQANIITTIRNKITGKVLKLRNECRFGHGQFNGTPEAKMYYENKGTLDIIYERL
ncbi:MAG: hypothetical protein ACI4VX_01485 [Succinivibrionaceae bacterium]